MYILRFVILGLIAAAGASAKQVTVTLLATADLHGNIYPVDYFAGRPAARGLAKIATLVQSVRSQNPNTLLIDCGDTIEGTPLESVYQEYVSKGRLPLDLTFAREPFQHDPMMLVMNQLDYRAMVLGNHEFNYGLKNIERARLDARFPWISANTTVEPGAQLKRFDRYIFDTVAGVKVAIIGVTTPAVPSWEPPDHYRGYRFLPGKQAVESALQELRRDDPPNLTILAVHAGLEPEGSASGENMVRELATGVPGIDAIVFGHTHQEMEGDRIGDVLLAQPKNWGISLARMDFVFESVREGGWKLVRKSSRLLPVTDNTKLDPEVIRIARPYHETAERYLNTPIAESPVEMDGRLGRIEDSPIVDAIHAVQMQYTKADVSFTSLFNTRAMVPKGPVTVRQIAAMYMYENEVYTVEGDGRMIKDALENAARYFQTCPDPACSHGPLLRQDFPGFNFDMAEGVDYEIDLTKPEGQRIVNLRWKGQTLRPDQKLRIAINSYRAGGSGGYGMFRNAKIVSRSPEDVRSLIISYYTEHRRLPERADGNWRIVPPQALKVLEQEVESSR